MFSRLEEQICSHISGEEEAIRVMSLKPPGSQGFHSLFSFGIFIPYKIHQGGGNDVRQVADAGGGKIVFLAGENHGKGL